MKLLLFLSFLVNISCIDALKSATEEEDEDEDDERREGTRQGDCLDGTDNDDDGDIDCEDSGCFDKPACNGDTAVTNDPSDEPNSEPAEEPSEEPSEEPIIVDFHGQISYTVDYGSELEAEGMYDCLVSDVLTPHTHSATYTDYCPDCTIFGRVNVEREHSCRNWSVEDGSRYFAIAESTQTLQHFTYSWNELYSEEECNISRTVNLTDSSMTIECVMDLPAPDIPAWRQTIHFYLTW